MAAQFEIDLYAAVEQAAAASTATWCCTASPGHEVDFSFEKNGRKHTFKKEFEGVLANLQRRFDEYERRRREQGRTSEQDFEAIYDEFHRYMSQTPVRGVRRHAPAQGGALRARSAARASSR